MADLDACAARQAFLARQLGIHRRRGFVAGASQGSQQGLDRPPDIVLGRMQIQGHEVLFSFGNDPDRSIRVDGDLAHAAVQAQERSEKSKPAHPGDHFPGDIFDLRFGDLDAQSPGGSQDALGRQGNKLLRILAQLLQRPSFEGFGDFFDDLSALGGFDLGNDGAPA